MATQEPRIGQTTVTPSYRMDLRLMAKPDRFITSPRIDWNELTWKKVGRPYRVEKWSKEKHDWEREHNSDMPVKTAWEHFNRSFQSLFDTNIPAAMADSWRGLWQDLKTGDLHAAQEVISELVELAIWNNVHRVEDAVWDPRGKRALFAGLDVKKPRILFLGAADGYEAMQLMAMYPGGHAVLVDYDDYCRTDRFGRFPERYPFLGIDPTGAHAQVWHRDEMAIDFEVEDIRNLKYGKEFDIVLSVGLLEHFPDQYKPLALDFHRRFLKPGGYAIMTTPRKQLRSKLFYTLLADTMNYSYRELMDIHQMGLYVYENGFEILRHGTIKAHNGIIARAR